MPTAEMKGVEETTSNKYLNITLTTKNSETSKYTSKLTVGW